MAANDINLGLADIFRRGAVYAGDVADRKLVRVDQKHSPHSKPDELFCNGRSGPATTHDTDPQTTKRALNGRSEGADVSVERGQEAAFILKGRPEQPELIACTEQPLDRERVAADLIKMTGEREPVQLGRDNERAVK